MIRRSNFRRVSLCVVLCAAVCPFTAAVSFGQSPDSQAGASGGRVQGRALKHTPEEERLLRESRAEIVATGFSEAYFDAHFEPVRVMNSPGDRRVIWRFRVNGHEALVNDSVGFYTDAGGRRVDTHTVAATLGETRDIRRTISRRRAERVMRACIGKFEGGAVTYQRFGADGRAALVLTAVSVPPPAPANANRPAPQSSATQAGGTRQYDGPGRGGKKKPFLLIGSVNLETGRCVKGVAQVGSPQPAPAKPAPRPRRRR